MIHVTTEDAQAQVDLCRIGNFTAEGAHRQLVECAAMIQALASERNALMSAMRNLCESPCNDPNRGRSNEGRWLALTVRAHHAHEAVALLKP
jgi:hypothetical protein